MTRRAALRVCAACEWIFLAPAPAGCPQCGFSHYGARFVYGHAAYRFAQSQEPWFKRKMANLAVKLRRQIAESKAGKPSQQPHRGCL